MTEGDAMPFWKRKKDDEAQDEKAERPKPKPPPRRPKYGVPECYTLREREKAPPPDEEIRP